MPTWMNSTRLGHASRVLKMLPRSLDSHLDTSPETTGENVKPQVIEQYAGGDIALPGDSSKSLLWPSVGMNNLVGKTLITTDGTTLLGGDDKAGIAIIMEAASYLIEHPEYLMAPSVYCSHAMRKSVEVNHVDIDKVGQWLPIRSMAEVPVISILKRSQPTDFVQVKGVNIHPSIAKDRMVNALRAAGTFGSLASRAGSEATEDRVGFIHLYVLEGKSPSEYQDSSERF